MPFYGAAAFTRRPEVAIIYTCMCRNYTVMSHDLPGYSVPPPAVHFAGKCKMWSSLVESLIGNFLWDVPMHKFVQLTLKGDVYSSIAYHSQY